MKLKGGNWIYPLILIIGVIVIWSCSKSNDNQPGVTRDIDGNVYHTVKIGTQAWMVENLKTTKYRNGDPIPNVTANSGWSALSTGAYCWFNNDETANKTAYGALYNWYAVSDNRNIAPKGWHLPSDDEWKTLEVFLGMTMAQANDSSSSQSSGWRGTDQGCKLKEAGTSHWKNNNITTTNTSGFTALPGNRRDLGGVFSSDILEIGYLAWFWTKTQNNSTTAWYRQLASTYDQVGRDPCSKKFGFSVRLVQD